MQSLRPFRPVNIVHKSPLIRGLSGLAFEASRPESGGTCAVFYLAVVLLLPPVRIDMLIGFPG